MKRILKAGDADETAREVRTGARGDACKRSEPPSQSAATAPGPGQAAVHKGFQAACWNRS